MPVHDGDSPHAFWIRSNAAAFRHSHFSITSGLTSIFLMLYITSQMLYELRSAEELAYHYLLDQILERNLAGGTRVDLDAVARRLGVSRMPVRDAVRRLASEGLLTIYPRRGVVVTSLRPSEIRELFGMRAVLEGLAARQAMATIGSDDIARLEEISAQMEAVQSDPASWAGRHSEFHDFLCSRSRWTRLTAQARTVRQQIEPYARMFLASYKAEVPGADHRSLIEAIRHGDASAIEMVVKNHVMLAADLIVEFVERLAGA